MLLRNHVLVVGLTYIRPVKETIRRVISPAIGGY